MTIVEKGELYYVDFGKPRGSEQGGYRPVVIIQNDIGNITSLTTIVAPLTSQAKRKLPTHVVVNHKGLKTTSVILTEQIQTVDKNRLTHYIGKLNDDQINEVNKALMISLDMERKEND